MVKKPARLAAKIALFVIAIFVLIPIVIALMSTPVHAAEVISPDKFESLKPFEHFAKGEGEGVAYLYKARTKADFIAILRDKKLAKKEMRVKCEVLVRQMMEGHADLPFEGCEGAAKAIESDDFTVVACRDEMFKQNNFLTVTNADGSAFGVWHRKCLPNEKVLVYKDQLLLSTTCLNVAVPVVPSKASLVPITPIVLKSPLVAPPAILTCPDIYTLNLRVWQESVRKLFGIGRVIDAERSIVNGFANRVDFSRNYGGRLRAAEAKGDPNAKLSETPRRFRISFINTDEARGGSSDITAEKFLYDVTVTGLIPMRFAESELEKWDAIRTVSIDDDVQSPPTFGKTGVHELRFFNLLPRDIDPKTGLPFLTESGKRSKLGEWANNPTDDCLMNEHTTELKQSVPPLVRPAAVLPQQQ